MAVAMLAIDAQKPGGPAAPAPPSGVKVNPDPIAFFGQMGRTGWNGQGSVKVENN